MSLYEVDPPHKTMEDAVISAFTECMTNGESMIYLRRTDTGIKVQVLTRSEVPDDQATHH